MSWNDCTKEEQKVTLKCLIAIVDGPFFPDWEFSSLMGIQKEDLKEIISKWDFLDKESDELKSIIFNAIANLLSYPHGYKNLIEEYIPTFTNEEYLKNILYKLDAK